MDDIDPKSGFHWQSRRIGYTNPLEHDRYVSHLLERLSELQERTDPRLGENSAKGKDLAAFQALEYARKLVDAVAGWAIDHQIGLAIEGREFIPQYPPEVRELPQYQESKAEVDNHRHEALGTELRLAPIPESAKRQSAINLLRANCGAFPSDIAKDLRESLEALDQNEIMPILQKSGKWKKKGLRETKLMMLAVTFVAFRGASKLMSSGDAHHEVAEAYGVSFDTLRGWEKWLRDNLGQTQVAAAKRRAKNAASYVATKASIRSAALASLESSDEYGSKALKSAGDEYKRQLWLSERTE